MPPVQTCRPPKDPLALIVVSDGKDQDNAPVKAAQALKQAFGDRLCITTVQVGDDPAGASVLNQIAAAGQCGFSSNADQIMSPAGMADFVEKVFLGKVAPKPAAGPTRQRRRRRLSTTWTNAPTHPKVRRLTMSVVRWTVTATVSLTTRTNAPTPRWVHRVDSRGCWVLAGVKFDTGKSDIKTEYYPMLNEVVALLQKNKSIQVVVEGHTDNVGSAKLNQTLSENRAKSVMNFLISSGIAGSRLSSRGYGFSRPAATNDTAAGRQLNRRVELRPLN